MSESANKCVYQLRENGSLWLHLGVLVGIWEGGKPMKVRQFLNKLLYASSSIHRIFVVRGVEEKTQLVGVAVNPMATDTPYERQLNATLVSFRINGEDLTIYVK